MTRVPKRSLEILSEINGVDTVHDTKMLVGPLLSEDVPRIEGALLWGSLAPTIRAMAQELLELRGTAKARLVALTDDPGYVLYDMDGHSIEFFDTHEEGLDYAEARGYTLEAE